MKTYSVTRIDTYNVTFEASNLKEAKKMLEDDDSLLNDGDYCGSNFVDLELDE